MKIQKITMKPCITSPLEVLQFVAKIADEYDIYHSEITDAEINAFLFSRCMKASGGKLPMPHIIKCIPTVISLIRENKGYYGLCQSEDPKKTV